MSKSPRDLAPGRAMFSKSTSTASTCSAMWGASSELWVPRERGLVMRRDATFPPVGRNLVPR